MDQSTLFIVSSATDTTALSMGAAERTQASVDSLDWVHILVATAGELSPEPVADFIAHLDHGPAPVQVATVIEVPRSFLDEIRSEGWHPLGEGGTDEGPSEEDEVIARYVEERGARLTEPIVAALRNRDVESEALFLEGEDPAATLVTAAEAVGADLIVLGATKRLFDETHWESVTTRVIRESGVPVLVVPAAAREDTAELELPTSEFELD